MAREEDIQALCEAVLERENYIKYSHYEDTFYCTFCGAKEKGGAIHHSPYCELLIAQDLTTRIKS